MSLRPAPLAPGLPAQDQTAGITLMLVAILGFTLMDATAKSLTASYDPMQVVWVRFAANAALFVVIFRTRLPAILRTSRPGTHLLRSLMQLASVLLFFTSLRYIGLAEATAIMDINPVLITLGAALFLGEPIGPRRLMGVAAAMLGAFIIIRPGIGVFDPAAILPLIAAFTYAAGALLTRSLRGDSVATAVAWSALVGVSLSALALPFVWSPIALRDLPLFAALGVFGTVSQWFLVRAYATAEAGALAPFGYTGLLWAGLWGWLFFGQVPDLWTVTGAGIIVSAGIYIWSREMQMTRRRRG